MKKKKKKIELTPKELLKGEPFKPFGLVLDPSILSKKQIEYIQFIDAFRENYGYWPSYTEVANAFGVKRSTVCGVINKKGVRYNRRSACPFVFWGSVEVGEEDNPKKTSNEERQV